MKQFISLLLFSAFAVTVNAQGTTSTPEENQSVKISVAANTYDGDLPHLSSQKRNVPEMTKNVNPSERFIPILGNKVLEKPNNFEEQNFTASTAIPLSNYFSSLNLSKADLTYCTAGGASSTNYSISLVSVSNVINPSGAANYTNFTANPALLINLTKGLSYSFTVNANVAAFNFASVFIDYNSDGVFDAAERVLNFAVANTASFTGNFTVPNSAITALPLRMRILLGYAGPANVGLLAPASWVCGNSSFNGEVEDYNVLISSNLAVGEGGNLKDAIQIYPNPAGEFLHITKATDKVLYEIYSVSGQRISKGLVKDGKVNVAQLMKGNYIIKISEKGITNSLQFIKN